MTPEAKSLHISRAVTPSEIRSVQGLFREYGDWVRTLPSLADHDPTIRNLEWEIASLPGIYAPPSGCLLLATRHGRPAGCFALKPHQGGTGELKRLYVRPGFRGLRIGRELVASAIAAAREAGYRRLILDSHVAMTPAHALYEAAGFRRVATPAGFSEALRPVIVFMEMRIESVAQGEGGGLSGELPRIFEFMLELDKLKLVLRRTKPAGLDRYENPAEHSWQITLLALLLAGHSSGPLDRLRVVEILLVHDIPEIDAGDQLVYEGPSEARHDAELRAARRIFGLLPEPQAAWCLERWMEYEARESDEARFAYAVDRLMPLLQNLANEGQSWRENDVPLEKVLAVNAVLGEVLPGAWERVKASLQECANRGFFGGTGSRRAPTT